MKIETSEFVSGSPDVSVNGSLSDSDLSEDRSEVIVFCNERDRDRREEVMASGR